MSALIIVFGLQGEALDWCCTVLQKLLGQWGEGADIVRVRTLEDFSVHLLNTTSPLIVASVAPEDALLNVFRRSEHPVILVEDTPASAASDRMSALGEADVNAVRGVLAEFAILQDVSEIKQVLRIEYRQALKDTHTAIRTMAGYLQVLLGAQTALPAIDDLDVLPPGELTIDSGHDALPPVLSARQQRVIEFALGAVDAEGVTASTRIVLGLEFFQDVSSAPLEAATLDASGRARLLSLGPHLFLPRGEWKARIVHHFSADLATLPFTVDAVSWMGGVPRDLGRTTFMVPTSGGAMETSLAFTVVEPRAIIEIRLFVDRAVFNGNVTIGYVEIKPNLPARSGLSSLQIDVGSE